MRLTLSTSPYGSYWLYLIMILIRYQIKKEICPCAQLIRHYVRETCGEVELYLHFS